MGKTKKDFITSVAELLPEGLDETLVNGIANLLSEKINSEVASEVQALQRKTVSFVRGQIDKLKEQALKELELENETFRNAQMFETVRSMFAVELTGDDELNAVNALASLGEQQEHKMDVLVQEMDKVLKENTKLKNSVKLLLDKNKLLESTAESLKEQATLAESKGQTRVLSDAAVVVSENNFKRKEQPKKSEADKIRESTNNEFLSNDVLKAVKTLNQ